MKHPSESAVVKSLLVTPAQAKLIDAGETLRLSPGTIDDACFLHSVLCQVGMPRKRTPGLSFERTSGFDSLKLTAGSVYDGRGHWIQQSLPYGPKPRLILINLTTMAVLTKSNVIDVGRSTREFMSRVGLDPQGSEYRSLRRQVAALAACRMQLGTMVNGRAKTGDFQPIKEFDVWIVPNEEQQTLWPGTVELSKQYFESVMESAVPLDERAIAALRGTALGLDVYSWLAHRLFRVKDRNGSVVRWQAIKSQFGQEYRTMKAFRQEFRQTLKHVLAVYQTAKIEECSEGLRLRHSMPPIPPRLLVPGV